MFTKDGIVTGATSRRNNRSLSLALASSRRERFFADACKPTALAVVILQAFGMSGCFATAPATGAASLAAGAAKGTMPAAGPAKSDAQRVQTATNNAGVSQHPEATPPAQMPAPKDERQTIRQELAGGEYSKAHQDLELVTRNSDQLSQAERREVKDDLSLSKYLIGQSSHPSLKQQRTCSEALPEQGSVSGAILARIHDSIRQSAVEQVRRALKAQDLASAEGAALAYTTSSGADPDLIGGWSEDFWRVVHDQERPADRAQRISPVIAQLANEYPQVKSMSESEFTGRIVADATVSGKSIVSRLVLKGDSLDLIVPQRDLDFVATQALPRRHLRRRAQYRRPYPALPAPRAPSKYFLPHRAANPNPRASLSRRTPSAGLRRCSPPTGRSVRLLSSDHPRRRRGRVRRSPINRRKANSRRARFFEVSHRFRSIFCHYSLRTGSLYGCATARFTAEVLRCLSTCSSSRFLIVGLDSQPPAVLWPHKPHSLRQRGSVLQRGIR
jgi:hypothetical protein